MEIREKLIGTLIGHFWKDLSESVKHFSNPDDKIKITGILIEYLKGVYNYYPENEYFETQEFDEDEFIEKNLLEPYRDKMVPFIKNRITYYFAKDEHTKTQLFKKLQINEPVLDYQEYTDYIVRLFVLLRNIKKGLYLTPTGSVNSSGISQTEIKELTESPEELEKEGLKVTTKGFTRPRQMLLFFYVMKLIGKNISSNNSPLAAYTRFAHALTGLDYTTMDNATFYKYVKKLPYLKADKFLLPDLEFVKRQFEDIDHQEGIALVQKEIDSIKKS